MKVRLSIVALTGLAACAAVAGERTLASFDGAASAGARIESIIANDGTSWSARHCDVVSFNIYGRDLSDRRLPDGVDRPVIVGEFHMGATDRDPFHAGVIGCRSQAERARGYVRYVRSALENPQIVGVHWHQFGDQPATGRFDGESFQVGLVDCCDTPYPETVAAIREIAYPMYEIRRADKSHKAH